MASPISTISIVNTALEQIASQARITSLDPALDASKVAAAAAVVYEPTIWLMLRELDPDFARYTAPLAVAVAPSQVTPWAFEYTYPADCVRVRQVRPAAGAYDVNNPQVVRSQVAFDLIANVKSKVILTNQDSALAVYTTANVDESMFDAAFADTVARRLANPLAMALSGRPDFAEKILEQSAKMAATCEIIDESSVRRPV